MRVLPSTGGLADFLGELLELVAALLAFVAELALDRLQLLVQIIFALGLLHLALDPAADLLLDLEHAELAFHEGEHHLQPARGIELAQQRLLVGDLDRQVRRHGVGKRRRTSISELDAGFGRQPLVELGVIFELVDDRAHQRLRLGIRRPPPRRRPRSRRPCSRREQKIDQPRPLHAFDQHSNRAVGQLQKLHRGGDTPRS